MSGQVSDHIRSNLWGIAACLIALTGGAVVANASDGGSGAAKAAGATKQIKKLKRRSADLERRLAALEGRPGPTIPARLPPSGPAGGELAGTYPNPTVGTVNGLQLAESIGINEGINFGSDARLHRSGAGRLRVGANLEVGAGFEATQDAFLGNAFGDETFLSGFLHLTPNNAPAAASCNSADEAGRFAFNATEDELWVCDGASGWKQVAVN